MNLRRFVMISMASLLLFVAYIGGCGGDGQTGALAGSGGGGGGVANCKKDSFPDQDTPCTNCLVANCEKQFNDCCAAVHCPTLAKEARGKACSGADCYALIKTSVDDPDIGGGVTGAGWVAAVPLIECTVKSCVDPATMTQICKR